VETGRARSLNQSAAVVLPVRCIDEQRSLQSRGTRPAICCHLLRFTETRSRKWSQLAGGNGQGPRATAGARRRSASGATTQERECVVPARAPSAPNRDASGPRCACAPELRTLGVLSPWTASPVTVRGRRVHGQESVDWRLHAHRWAFHAKWLFEPMATHTQCPDTGTKDCALVCPPVRRNVIVRQTVPHAVGRVGRRGARFARSVGSIGTSQDPNRSPRHGDGNGPSIGDGSASSGEKGASAPRTPGWPRRDAQPCGLLSSPTTAGDRPTCADLTLSPSVRASNESPARRPHWSR
jgi:hypothetical protein